MFIIDFFVGLLIVIAGALMVRFNANLAHLFPKSQFLERYIGMGSSFAMFYVVAFLIITFGFLLMFGLLDDLGRALLPGS